MNPRIGGATCRFIREFPAFFEGDLKKLERKYPNVRADLDNLLEKIEKDYRHVAHARRLQGFGDIATPLVMLAKAKSEDVPPKLLRTRINDL